MSHHEDHELPEVHGIKIDPNGHDHALSFLEKHMDKEQLHEMVHNAKLPSEKDHNSHFTVLKGHGYNQDMRFKISNHDGHLKIEQVHHHML